MASRGSAHAAAGKRPASDVLAAGWLPAGWDEERDLLVLAGKGAGELAARFAGGGQKRLVVHEPGPGAEPVAGVAFTRTPAELLEAILSMPGPPPVRVSLHRAPGVERPDLREVARLVEGAILSRKLQTKTAERFGEAWLENGIANLDLLARLPSIHHLRGAFAGEACVIVSPGPSLSKNVHLLERFRGKALLMTGTHALGAFARAGVAPDLVVVSDPGDEVARHYEGFDLASIGALFVEATCPREHLERPAPRVATFGCSGQIDDWIYGCAGEQARVSSGGSVACAELSLALHMGCDPIVLVGQDLSFPEGRYYADGTLDGCARVELGEDGSFFLRKPGGSDGPGLPMEDGSVRFTLSRPVVRVPGYHGGEVPSSESFRAFLLWFEALARSVEGVRLWNCTEGGARIGGMEQRTLASALEELGGASLDAGAQLDEAFGAIDFAARRERFAAAAAERIEALERCTRAAKTCGRLAKRAARDPRALEELGRREAELSAALAPVRFVSLLAQGAIERARERGTRARTVQANLAAARELHGVVERAGERVTASLRRALGRLRP